MNDFISDINSYLWGLPMIALLLFLHLFMTVKTRFVQRKVLTGIRLSLSRQQGDSGEISPFQSLATSLASTLGTGNIIGVGTAIALGGAGAVFWCWITGVVGMATMYAESLLAVRYRVRSPSGAYVGGPMYVLSLGLNMKPLAVLYAAVAAVAGLITGASIQANAMSATVAPYFSGTVVRIFGRETELVPVIVGLAAAAVTAVVIFGGVKSVSRACETIVPFMAAAFTLGCIAVLVINRAVLWQSIELIIRSAFVPTAAFGGFVGSSFLCACRYGTARGLFSNEAGVGTAAIVCAAARTPNPVRQALVSMTATFWDTVVMCLVTGVVIVSSMLANPGGADVTGDRLTCSAFSQIPYIGTPVLVFSMVTFALSTILGWSYNGERCAEFLFGEKGITPYRVLWVAAVLTAPVLTVDFVWNLADLLNALLAVPNVFAVLMLSGEVGKVTRRYIASPSEQ